VRLDGSPRVGGVVFRKPSALWADWAAPA
jgi:hypothetical protein